MRMREGGTDGASRRRRSAWHVAEKCKERKAGGDGNTATTQQHYDLPSASVSRVVPLDVVRFEACLGRREVLAAYAQVERKRTDHGRADLGTCCLPAATDGPR